MINIDQGLIGHLEEGRYVTATARSEGHVRKSRVDGDEGAQVGHGQPEQVIG